MADWRACGRGQVHRAPGVSRDEEYFVEFVDVGGHRRYEKSRKVFYDGIHGQAVRPRVRACL